MMDKDTMEDIYHKINMFYGDEIACVYSDDNSSKLIFRIRIMQIKKGDKDRINDLSTLKGYIKSI